MWPAWRKGRENTLSVKLAPSKGLINGRYYQADPRRPTGDEIMSRRTKKVGVAGRLGARYGLSVRKQVKNIVDRIAKENGLWDHSKNAKDEMAALKDSAAHISTELNLEVIIHSSERPDYDPQNKARFALPGRVSLFLE